MSLRARLALFMFVCAPIAAGLSCSANSTSDSSLTGGNEGTGTGAGNNGGTSGTNPSGGSSGTGHINMVDVTANVPGCGNNKDDGAEEECDDGNLNGGDGCNGACRIEADWTCPKVGPCTADACGNGVLASFEVCDDGNTTGGDGCAADCKSIEDGWQCRVPGKRCVPLCGDGKLTAMEKCDDGNTNSMDGCSSTCLVEP